MRLERWYWLLVFCAISYLIHWGLVLESGSFYMPGRLSRPAEIEVALEPLPEPKPAPKPKPKPEPKPQPKPALKSEPKPAPRPATVVRAKAKPSLVVAKAQERPELRRIVRAPKRDVEKAPTAPNVDTGGIETIKKETPTTTGLPTGRKNASPLPIKIARADPNLGGGGSPSPAPIPGGHGGASTPETPPEDILYSGGGAGGEKLPKAAPRIGGGGGSSILSVENPLAKDAVPEEKPGVGPGLGSGQGVGAGGGLGAGRGPGIGTRLDGKDALATLHSKPGPGIGASEGRNTGTHPPGGGKGTGAELPGTGGEGTGYGRGRGIGVGNGGGMGAGAGNGGGQTGRMRGVPFGDITGLLDGDPDGGGGKGGGPGGSGRGAVFGARPSGGKNSAIHIVYLLDSSGSMREGDKIGQAKTALKKALTELKPRDSFNIIHFDRTIHPFALEMVPATLPNLQEALDFVDSIRLRDMTDLSDALEAAFVLRPLTHIFVLSDGEPHGGIEDPDELRAMVKEKNTQKVQIMTLALGLGEHFRGMDLLKGIAEDNNGRFNYINLAK